MQVQERLELQRDCMAVRVPSGDQVILSKGAEVGIVQALGGSFTVQVHGMLFRIDGDNADALGKEPPPRPEVPENATEADVEAAIWDQMRTCYDPEIPINIVDLGLVYECLLERRDDAVSRKATIRMTLTAPGCGMGEVLADDVRYKVTRVPTVDEADVYVVFDPPWSTDMMTDEAKLKLGVF